MSTGTDLLALTRLKGTDAEYRAWVQRQPSCVSGRFSEWVDGEGRCEAAHHRTAATSGTGFKAPYSCVPLTRAEHARQHQHGASALGDRDWWERQVERHLRRWVES